MVWFFVIVAIVIAAAAGLYWRWRRSIDAEIVEGADIEWAHFKKNEPEFLNGVTEENFREIYARVHTPRFPGYALAIGATFFAALPVSFVALFLLLLGAEQFGMIPEPIDVADRLFIEDDKLVFFKDTPPEAALYYINDLGGFYYFFGMLCIWLCVVAFYMRRYHARRPGYLRDEIIRFREA